MNVYMARQPIFNHDGSVYAYELLYRNNDKENTHPKGEPSEIEDDFFGSDIKNIVGSARVLINFTDELFRYRAGRHISPHILIAEICGDQVEDKFNTEAVQDLKDRGYLISLNGVDKSNDIFPLGDIVRIDLNAPQKQIEELAYVCRYSNKLMIAKNVETKSRFETAKTLGCTYIQGGYFAHPIMTNSIQPLPSSLMQTMRLMAEPNPEIKDIVDVMSRDYALCQKILRLINSVYFGMSNRVSSINQAILILGIDYLREWVYLLGMQKITQNENLEMMKLSLLLAKFCCGIAEHIPEVSEQSEAFYLMGLLSTMVFSGERALIQALDEFPLTEDIKKGLLLRGGLYSEILEMTMAYIDGKWDYFDELAVKYRLRSDDMCRLFEQCTKEVERLDTV